MGRPNTGTMTPKELAREQRGVEECSKGWAHASSSVESAGAWPRPQDIYD